MPRCSSSRSVGARSETRSGCPPAGGSPLASVCDRASRSITSRSSATALWPPPSRSGATTRPRATLSPSPSREAAGTCSAPGATGPRCRSSICTRSARGARSMCEWAGSPCAHGRMPPSSCAGSIASTKRRELTKRGTRRSSGSTFWGCSPRRGRCTPSRWVPRARSRSRGFLLRHRHTMSVGYTPTPVGPRFVATSNMLTAPASPRRDSGSQRGDVQTALMTAAAPASGDYPGWRLLASHGPFSGPFVDPHWMLSWTEAFAPQEPVLVCARDGRRLVGLAALQRVVEFWGGRRLVVLQSRTNAESFRFAFVSCRGRVDIHEQLCRAVCQSGDCDVIRIEHVPEGSPTLAAALTVAEDVGWRSLLQPTFLTPWRLLSPAVPRADGLTRAFTRHRRRAQRRMGELGDVRFEVVTTGRRLKQALEVF